MGTSGRRAGVIAVLLGLSACTNIHIKAVRADSDPHLQDQERLREKIEETNTDVFIQEHPELDDQTKKDLRDGRISRKAAMEKIKKNEH